RACLWSGRPSGGLHGGRPRPGPVKRPCFRGAAVGTGRWWRWGGGRGRGAGPPFRPPPGTPAAGGRGGGPPPAGATDVSTDTGRGSIPAALCVSPPSGRVRYFFRRRAAKAGPSISQTRPSRGGKRLTTTTWHLTLRRPPAVPAISPLFSPLTVVKSL